MSAVCISAQKHDSSPLKNKPATRFRKPEGAKIFLRLHSRLAESQRFQPPGEFARYQRKFRRQMYRSQPQGPSNPARKWRRAATFVIEGLAEWRRLRSAERLTLYHAYASPSRPKNFPLCSIVSPVMV